MKTGNPSPEEKGNRNTTGIVVTGLVTIVGSWVGMAAYMDYRIQNIEKKLSNETKQIASTLVNNQSALDSKLKQPILYNRL